MVSILDNIISVNSPVLCSMDENGEPEKSFVENELKKIQKYAESIDNSQTENPEESVKAEYLKEFLSMPMKDLMNEVKVNELNLNKKSSKPDMQIDKTSISSESPSFPVEPQLSIGSRATHIILQNDTEHQAPNFDAIINDLTLSSDTYQVDLVSVRECITKKVNSTFSNDKYKMILDKLEKFGNSVDFKTLKESKIFAHHSRSKNVQWIRNLIDELYTEKGVLVSLEIRSERMDKRYELSNITDIQYFDVKRFVYNSERNIAKEIPSMSYICGHHYKGMHSSLPVGCIIRSVIWQKECQFKEIIKTMAVDFVRNNYYYTVLPFPFKYLREYAKMILNDS